MQETGDDEEEIYDKSAIKQTLVVARETSQTVTYLDRKCDFKSRRNSDKSDTDFISSGRLFQFEIILGTGK